MTAGKGIEATVGTRRLLCGSERFLTERGVRPGPEVRAALDRLRAEGKASILAADGTDCLGVIDLSGVLRPEARDVAARPSAMGTRTVLLTGNNERTAAYFAQQAGPLLYTSRARIAFAPA